MNQLSIASNRAILFGDVRGYSGLSSDQIVAFYERALPALRKRLDERLREQGLVFGAQWDQAETWGDGVAVVHAAPAEAAVFAVLLAETFDEPGWQAAVGPGTLLRIRVALHAGHLWEGTRNWISLREQHVGSSMVLPARLEPRVRPGQVWCTPDFKDIYESSPAERAKLVFDGPFPIELAKNAGPVEVYRVRFERHEEQRLREIEEELEAADRTRDDERFLAAYDRLRETARPAWLPLSRYRGWEELGKRLLRRDLAREAEALFLGYRQHLADVLLLSPDVEVDLGCLLANAAATSAKDVGAFERAREYVKSAERWIKSDADSIELRSIVAAQQKRLGLLTQDLRVRRALLQEAHDAYWNEYRRDGFSYYPGVNAATTGMYLSALDPDGTGLRRRARRTAKALVFRFTDLRRPRDFWEQATLAEAHVLLGDAKRARAEGARAAALARGKDEWFQSRSFRRQMKQMVAFRPRLPRKVREAARVALRASRA